MPILCHSNEIAERKSKGFQLGEKFLFAVKKNSRIYVYENLCPHLGIQLEWQPDEFLDIDASMIQCSSHGALFNIENGECLFGPCVGQSLIAVDFTINDGQIDITD
ncbi:Rieske 2Fe-2S family protein [Oleispira antarctica RB-8]|uniref:Rieske 2Fe-2S family protein n=1 Tax=Oleispira antarctica RB-8 TaxID=698738 RepID=R4YR50_OLEAN|nr:Rieske 2Fe-2S family protein [Oleispira antarctica RB-8]